MTQTFEFRGYGWASRYKGPGIAYDGIDVHMAAGDVLAQVPPLPSEDRQFSIRGVPLAYDPTTTLAKADGYYYPLTLSIASSIDIHRPDGVKRSDYVTSDGAKLAVTENATTTDFVVTTAGATATRTLVTHWNQYLDPADPLFSWSAYSILKHRSDLGEDVWWWNTYAYLQTVWRCPVATTLVMRLDWNHLQVTDTHESSPAAREANFEVLALPGFALYTFDLAADAGNDQTVTLDLLLPDGYAFPNYPGRISSIQFSGFVPGGGGPATVTLKQMNLASAASSLYYPKAAVSTTEQRKQYSMITLAHDGAYVTGHIPDEIYKPNQGAVGYGGAPRHTDPMTGSVSGVITDTMKTVEAVWAELNLIEGVTATYSASAFTTANGDGVNVLNTEPADFIWNTFPTSGVPLATAWTPKCCLTAFRLKPCNGINIRVMGELDVGAGIETVAVNADGTRAAGVNLQGYYMDADGTTKHVVASATTDAQGYAVVAPLPANRGADGENIDSGVERAS